MAWFPKKRSPIDRRLDELNRQIADLENQVRKQSQESLRRTEEAAPGPPPPSQDAKPTTPAASHPPGTSRPRFRTTVTPKGASPVHGIEPHEVDFFARRDRPVDFTLDTPHAPSAKQAETGKGGLAPDRKKGGIIDDLFSLFSKSKPQPEQERLASYLTTGSFQRLKPLRYEKRVARTRLIIMVAIIVVIVILIIKFVLR